jgi:hypothetical protein
MHAARVVSAGRRGQRMACPLEFNHRIGFSSVLDGVKTFDPMQKYEVCRKRPLAARPLNLVWGRFSIGNP